MGKQNMAMIERAMKMVFPFGQEGAGGEPGAPGMPTPPTADPKQAIDQLKRQLDALQRQLDGLKPTKED
jgi:polyhydroxyalkanoate synthesis regulator protein